eukprot:CAMPEP_0184673542 /NCGR_PEP_ID=MMETSP0308-20130426/86738_1 /TAXON_ID=38269 /ORGANISM="Gloeochaete witrockiana, Strain SAG 46.84" /LENGTH=375 /DNA_ID=CAMNT_0027121041 /DNA_START=615 /DNA_END=1742 /DNA_ORIENTATION=-
MIFAASPVSFPVFALATTLDMAKTLLDVVVGSQARTIHDIMRGKTRTSLVGKISVIVSVSITVAVTIGVGVMIGYILRKHNLAPTAPSDSGECTPSAPLILSDVAHSIQDAIDIEGRGKTSVSRKGSSVESGGRVSRSLSRRSSFEGEIHSPTKKEGLHHSNPNPNPSQGDSTAVLGSHQPKALRKTSSLPRTLSQERRDDDNNDVMLPRNSSHEGGMSCPKMLSSRRRSIEGPEIVHSYRSLAQDDNSSIAPSPAEATILLKEEDLVRHHANNGSHGKDTNHKRNHHPKYSSVPTEEDNNNNNNNNPSNDDDVAIVSQCIDEPSCTYGEASEAPHVSKEEEEVVATYQDKEAIILASGDGVVHTSRTCGKDCPR